jgi:hypothetical protein
MILQLEGNTGMYGEEAIITAKKIYVYFRGRKGRHK